MAEITISLRTNPRTGKKDIIIGMRSDEEALPHEHEQQHRAIVDKLIHGGIIKATELGQIVVEREGEETEADPVAPEQSQGTRKAQQAGHGS